MNIKSGSRTSLRRPTACARKIILARLPTATICSMRQIFALKNLCRTILLTETTAESGVTRTFARTEAAQLRLLAIARFGVGENAANDAGIFGKGHMFYLWTQSEGHLAAIDEPRCKRHGLRTERVQWPRFRHPDFRP